MLQPHLDHGALLLPLLNGMAHIDWARDRFGHGRVVGGVSLCSTTVNAEGDIVHLNDAAQLIFGSMADQPNRTEVERYWTRCWRPASRRNSPASAPIRSTRRSGTSG